MVSWDLYWERNWAALCALWFYIGPAAASVWTHFGQFLNSDFFNGALAAAAGAFFGGGALLVRQFKVDKARKLAILNDGASALNVSVALLANTYAQQVLPYSLELEKLRKHLQSHDNLDGYGDVSKAFDRVFSLRGDFKNSLDKIAEFANYDPVLVEYIKFYECAITSFHDALILRNEYLEKFHSYNAPLEKKLKFFLGLEHRNKHVENGYVSSTQLVKETLQACLFFGSLIEERFNNLALNVLGRRSKSKIQEFKIEDVHRAVIPEKNFIEGFLDLKSHPAQYQNF